MFAGLFNTSDEFLFAKLHARWAASVNEDRLDKLIQDGQQEALNKMMVQLGVNKVARTAVQKKLTSILIDELAKVIAIVDRATKDFYEQMALRYFFDNLKTIIHYYHSSSFEVAIENLLIDSHHLPQLDVEALLGAENTDVFCDLLPRISIKEELVKIIKAQRDNPDVFYIECDLDRFYYKNLHRSARALGLRARTLGTELVGMEIDLQNIIMVLRNQSLYELPLDSLSQLFIQNGKAFDDSMLNRFALAASSEEQLDVLPRNYKKMLIPLAHKELILSENALWNNLHKQAHKSFNDYNRPALSVIAYPYLKRFEMLNVSRVLEGMHFGLEASAISNMMIGAINV